MRGWAAILAARAAHAARAAPAAPSSYRTCGVLYNEGRAAHGRGFMVCQPGERRCAVREHCRLGHVASDGHELSLLRIQLKL